LQYSIYINGEYRSNVNGGVTNVAGCDVALNPSGDLYTGCNWQSVDLHEFDVQDWAVTIAVDALDAGGTGGWIGTAIVNGVEYPTDDSGAWKCFGGATNQVGLDGGWSAVNSGWHGDAPPDGWSTSDGTFDDSAWTETTSFGANGVGPWGDVNRHRTSAVGAGGLGTISDTSEWIWSADPNGHNDVYCRLVVPCPAASTLPTPIAPGDFTLEGSAVLDSTGQILSITQVQGSQSGRAWSPVPITATDDVMINFDFYCGDGSSA
jgi:hypothetical protein